MNIIQQPDSLSLSQNLKEFLITSDNQVSFVLRQGETEILSQRYDPSTEGYITINLRDVIHGRLSFQLKDSSSVYQQTELAANFTAIIDTTEVTFRVVRGGVDTPADSAANFLTQNFLTWQPSVKPVTYYSPEFLTYYAVGAGKVKLHAYFTDANGIVSSEKDYTITDLVPSVAYTIPLQYSVVAGWLGNKLPAYYDVWVESTAGYRLTYIQRYYAEDMRSHQEQWVLFENSLGGLDTFRAYGSDTLNAEHTHNLAEIDEVSQEYRVDTERKHQKNTGYLNKEEARWLLDFFPSQKKYLYTGSYLRRIVVTESNVTGKLQEAPVSYTFTYKYADSRPLLNLPRTDVPADVLDITIPEVGSFTVPPRLAEVPRLPLSEGALFPVQNPYSEEWGTTSMGAISEYLAKVLEEDYGFGKTSNAGTLSKDILVTAPKTGYFESGHVITAGKTWEEILRDMLYAPAKASLTGKLSTANDVEYGTDKGNITYTTARNGQGEVVKAYYDGNEANVMILSAESGGKQTAVRELEGTYSVNESYKATVVFAASKDGSLPEITLNHTISVNVRRKWFAGVVGTVPTTSAEVRALGSSGLYTGTGSYKFTIAGYKTFVICIPSGTIKEVSLERYQYNFMDLDSAAAPQKISVEGANGSSPVEYAMYIFRTATTSSEADRFTFKTTE